MFSASPPIRRHRFPSHPTGQITPVGDPGFGNDKQRRTEAAGAGNRLLIVVHEGKDIVLGELGAALEEVELDGDGKAGDVAANASAWAVKGRFASRVLPP